MSLIRIKTFKNGNLSDIEIECNEFCDKNDILSITPVPYKNNGVALIATYLIKETKKEKDEK